MNTRGFSICGINYREKNQPLAQMLNPYTKIMPNLTPKYGAIFHRSRIGEFAIVVVGAKHLLDKLRINHKSPKQMLCPPYDTADILVEMGRYKEENSGICLSFGVNGTIWVRFPNFENAAILSIDVIARAILFSNSPNLAFSEAPEK